MPHRSAYQKLLQDNQGKLPTHWAKVPLATLQQAATDVLDLLETCSQFYDQAFVNAEAWREAKKVDQPSLAAITQVIAGDLSGPTPDPKIMHVLWEGRQGAGPVTDCPREDLIKTLVRAHEDLEAVLTQSERVADLMQSLARRLRAGELLRSSVMENQLEEIQEAAKPKSVDSVSRRRPRPL